MANPYTEPVAAGIALLDAHEAPNWRQHIDRASFDVESSSQCPLGQIHGSFRVGRIVVDLDEDDCAKYGFFVPWELKDSRQAWILLNEAWVAALWPEA